VRFYFVTVFLLYKKRALNNKKINKIGITRGNLNFFSSNRPPGFFTGSWFKAFLVFGREKERMAVKLLIKRRRPLRVPPFDEQLFSVKKLQAPEGAWRLWVQRITTGSEEPRPA
jgi:hypothetical protein